MLEQSRKVAQRVIGVSLPSLECLYHERVCNKVKHIMQDLKTHPTPCLSIILTTVPECVYVHHAHVEPVADARLYLTLYIFSIHKYVDNCPIWKTFCICLYFCKCSAF
ncbi:hypothetical protein HOLleu_27955 [Holothuria leucospilota]|uniref:Uncharacterized protein n=1 Tax=Holothuria leucospilota TaxID=206669 RepID=A0A9Q1H2P8_HOLLE|nr:hypothetical protein HOLleu_27955 [Holothuria leucospilota]